MKKFTILVVCTLLLACSSTYPRGELYFFGPQRPATVLAGYAGESDPGLALYRDPRSRRAVESFYAAVAGDAQIGRIILQQASAYEIPLPLAFALAWGESQFNTRAFNRNPQSVDRGLFQLNSRTFPRVKADDFYEKLGRISREYVETMVPLRTMTKEGMHVAYGADVPAFPSHVPMDSIRSALDRTTASRRALDASEKISFAEALRDHTIGSAYAAFDEQELGSLEPGKYADFVIWEGDLAKVRTGRDAAALRVRATYIAGQPTYEAS